MDSRWFIPHKTRGPLKKEQPLTPGLWWYMPEGQELNPLQQFEKALPAKLLLGWDTKVDFLSTKKNLNFAQFQASVMHQYELLLTRLEYTPFEEIELFGKGYFQPLRGGGSTRKSFPKLVGCQSVGHLVEPDSTRLLQHSCSFVRIYGTAIASDIVVGVSVALKLVQATQDDASLNQLMDKAQKLCDGFSQSKLHRRDFEGTQPFFWSIP
jgi:hypothetical protein